MGGAGHWPAPVGDPPTGTGAAAPTSRPSSLARDARPVPSGESPDGTGQWPVLPRTQFPNTLLRFTRAPCLLPFVQLQPPEPHVALGQRVPPVPPAGEKVVARAARRGAFDPCGDHRLHGRLGTRAADVSVSLRGLTRLLHSSP